MEGNREKAKTYFFSLLPVILSDKLIQDEFVKIKPGLGNRAAVGNVSGIWTPDLYIYRLKSFKMRYSKITFN